MAIARDSSGGTSPNATKTAAQIATEAAATTYANAAKAVSATNSPTQAQINALKDAANAKTAHAPAPIDYAQVAASAKADVTAIGSTIKEVNSAVADVNTAGAEAGAISTSMGGPAYAPVNYTDNTTGKIVEPKKDPVYDALVAAMGVYNIQGLAGTLERIRMDYPDISSADMLTLLRNDTRYNKEYLTRFSGNQILSSNGKAMLEEKTYLQNEQAYAATFKAYGLDKYFSNTNQYAQLIGGEVSPTEVNNRVSAVFDRVLNADPSTLDVYKRYYKGLGTQDIVAALLDPKETMPAIQRKITSAEIGGAAVRQGLNAYQAATDIQSQRYSNVMDGTLGTDALTASGETAAQATADYARIAQELPRAEFLSSISRGYDQYGQKQAEGNQILGLASEKRKKDALVALEQARFQASSGTSQASFTNSKNTY